MRAEQDRLIKNLQCYGLPVICGFEATITDPLHGDWLKRALGCGWYHYC